METGPLPLAIRPFAYLWAAPGTLVGLLLAAVSLALPRPGGWVLVATGSRGFARLQARRDFRAITFGHLIIRTVRRGDEATPFSDRLRRHELVHVRQWEIFGPLMLVLYPLASVRGYERNPFERWARRVAE